MKAVAIVAVGLAVVLAACGRSPEPQYFTLNMNPSGQAAPKCGIEVQDIRASEPLARRQILIKKTPIQVEYYAIDQWAADPGQLVSEKLAAEFGHHPDAEKRIAIDGQLLGFEEVDTPAGPEAHIKLDLEFRRADADRFADPALKKTYELSLPVKGNGPTAVAETLSGGLEQVAAQIAADADKL